MDKAGVNPPFPENETDAKSIVLIVTEILWVSASTSLTEIAFPLIDENSND